MNYEEFEDYLREIEQEQGDRKSTCKHKSFSTILKNVKKTNYFSINYYLFFLEKDFNRQGLGHKKSISTLHRNAVTINLIC